MTMDMDDNHIISVAQLKELVKFGKCVKFNSNDKKETYEWIGRTLGKFQYFRESKKNKGIIKNYIMVMTGYSEGQIDKLIKRKKKYGKVFLMERTQHTFPKKYEASDVALLADTASILNHPNGIEYRTEAMISPAKVKGKVPKPNSRVSFPITPSGPMSTRR